MRCQGSVRLKHSDSSNQIRLFIGIYDSFYMTVLETEITNQETYVARREKKGRTDETSEMKAQNIMFDRTSSSGGSSGGGGGHRQENKIGGAIVALCGIPNTTSQGTHK